MPQYSGSAKSIIASLHIGPHPVEYCISKKWSSESQITKTNLRSSAANASRQWKSKYKKKSYHSISHTKKLGGYAVALCPVGFDIEHLYRKVSPRAAKRIATEKEYKLIPEPLFIWVIKEAAWKCLKGKHQPTTITKIKISSAKKNKPNSLIQFRFYTSTINGLRKYGQGVLIKNSRLIIGIAVI